MAITTDKATTINASYGLVAFPSVQINWPDLNGPVSAQYSVQKYRLSGEVNELDPTGGWNAGIPDLFALAAERASNGKPNLASALNSVMIALAELETEAGRI